MRRALLFTAPFLFICFIVSGCNTPETVSVFCASSSATLTESAPIFRDLAGSCLRKKNLRKELGTFDLVASDPDCDRVATMGQGAIAAATVLQHYFDALNDLASFNTVKTGSDNGDLIKQAAAAFNARPAVQTALGSIASFFTTAATQGYQQKSIAKDLAQVSTNIGAVTDALSSIVQENYINQELGKEDDDLATRYKTFAQAHNDGAVILHLDERWHADHDRLEERKLSAQALITSLGTIKAGVADLAANAHTLKAKELPALLKPYTEQLQTLIPQIQEAF